MRVLAPIANLNWRKVYICGSREPLSSTVTMSELTTIPEAPVYICPISLSCGKSYTVHYTRQIGFLKRARGNQPRRCS